MKLVSVAEMQAVEKEADANGLTYDMMMENAGDGLAGVVGSEFEGLKDGGILGLVGSGNNGGDTLVALTKLAESGWPATAYIVRKRPKGDPFIEGLISSNGKVIRISDDDDLKKLKSAILAHSVLMDGILGTGIKLPVRGRVADVLAITKNILFQLEDKPKVVAVDCPSGVDCDSGEASPECLAADLTVTMAAVKRGLLQFPANDLIGKLMLVGIGLDYEDKRSKSWRAIKRIVATPNWVRATMPPRNRDAHKGTFGTALIVAGSVNYSGAVLLAGKAAYRVGAGLVTLAVPAPLHSALAGHIPEGTWLILPDEMGVIASNAAEVVLENLDRITTMLLGPGFGIENETEDFLDKLFSSPTRNRRTGIGFIQEANQGETREKRELPPLVIDADGLKLLARIPDWHRKLPKLTVLTPHPGEMAVLTGLEINEIQSQRIETAERYAREWGHVVVLKGANTVIAEPGGRMSIIPVASSSLARAGTGDVLAGIIVGMRAQGVGAFEAAVSGCWIHAHSGLKAAKSLGTDTSVLAGDLLRSMVDVIHDLEYL
ncbi:MAG: NAD(P)H-hydrate dehydratase [Anaerolineales bacterium]